LANTTRKIERQNFSTGKQLEVVEKERTEMELKKKSLEKELVKAALYLNDEKKATKTTVDKNKKLEKETKKKTQD